MTQLSGSRLPIARHCDWAFRSTSEYPPPPELYNNEHGTRMHDVYAAYIEGKSPPPLTGEKRLLAEQMKLFWGDRKASAGVWEAERAYALDPAAPSARTLGKNMGRDYSSIMGGEIPLTVDYVGVHAGMPVVGDWKPPHDPHTEAPQDNLQLLAGAAAVSLSSGMDGCLIEIAKLDTNDHWVERYVATPLTLRRACAEIAAIQARIRDGQPGVARAGDHCAYCPALGSCPETSRMARAVLPNAQAKFTAEFVSDENDAMLVDELAALKKSIDSIEASLKARSREKGGIRLRDGKVYKMIVSSRSSTDKDKIVELLGPRYAECVRTISYEQFRRVKA
jgi:hypothetical protein